MEKFKGIHNLDLDLPSQVEYNRQKNLTQDSQIQNMSAQIQQLLEQAPAGFLPRVFYGLTRGNQTYRFTADAELSVALTGTVGTAFQLYSYNESDENYIPAVAVKLDDETIKIIIQGDYLTDSMSFKAVNMTTGASEDIVLTNVLSLQNASSLSEYTAIDNKEKQITVLHNLEDNSNNVVFASLDLNSDGVYNWVQIGHFTDGIDGLSIRSVNESNYDTIITQVKVGDSLLAASEFGIFVIGDVFTVTSLSPLALVKVGNIRGVQGETGATGATGQNGADGYTPYIQDGYWYINGTSTGVKAVGENGTDGQNGQSFQMQSGLYSTPSNWGQTGNVDGDGNPLQQLPALPQTNITGKGYVVYDPLTTPLSPFYDLYYANNGDVSWTIIHPFSGIAGTNGTDGETPYISGGTWWIGDTNTGVAATGPQGPTGKSDLYFIYGIYASSGAPANHITMSIANLSRAPEVGETLVMYSRNAYTNVIHMCKYIVSSLLANDNVYITLSASYQLTGAQGTNGKDPLNYNQTYSYAGDPQSTVSLSSTNMNRTPVVGDKIVLYWKNTSTNIMYVSQYSITSYNSSTQIADASRDFYEQITGGGGSALYQHNIRLQNPSGTNFVYINIINDSPTTFTLATLISYLYNSNNIKRNIVANGRYYDDDNGNCLVLKVGGNTSTSLSIQTWSLVQGVSVSYNIATNSGWTIDSQSYFIQ